MTMPIVSKFLLNHYAPYKGAGIAIDKIDLAKSSHSRQNATNTIKTKISSVYILAAAYIRWLTHFIC